MLQVYSLQQINQATDLDIHFLGTDFCMLRAWLLQKPPLVLINFRSFPCSAPCSSSSLHFMHLDLLISGTQFTFFPIAGKGLIICGEPYCHQALRRNSLMLHASWFSRGFAQLHVCTAECFLLLFLIPILSVRTVLLWPDKLVLFQLQQLAHTYCGVLLKSSLIISVQCQGLFHSTVFVLSGERNNQPFRSVTEDN